MLTGLESVLCGRKKSTCCLSVAEVDRQIEQLTTASEHCDLAIKVREPCLLKSDGEPEKTSGAGQAMFLTDLVRVRVHL